MSTEPITPSELAAADHAAQQAETQRQPGRKLIYRAAAPDGTTFDQVPASGVVYLQAVLLYMRLRKTGEKSTFNAWTLLKFITHEAHGPALCERIKGLYPTAVLEAIIVPAEPVEVETKPVIIVPSAPFSASPTGRIKPEAQLPVYNLTREGKTVEVPSSKPVTPPMTPELEALLMMELERRWDANEIEVDGPTRNGVEP